MKCLSHHKTKEDFFSEYRLFNKEQWYILNDTMSERADLLKKSIDNNQYINYLHDQFKENVNTYGNYYPELVSWLDSRLLIMRLFEQYNLPNDISIISEYQVPFNINSRVDFLFYFKNTIVLIEFTYHNQKSSFSRENYNSKWEQLIKYEAQISSYISKHTHIAKYVIQYLPEHNVRSKTKIEKNKNENDLILSNLASLIKHLYINDKALNEQLNIDSNNENKKRG